MSDPRLQNEYPSERITPPCLVLCGIFMLILGFVPALSGNLTQIFRPLFILVCLLFPARRYVLRSEKWQFVLLLYWLFILLLNPITASSVKYYLALVLFAIFSILASSRVWGKREIKFLLNTAVASALILSVILIYSNNGLINAGSDMHVSFLSHTCNRNTVAFGCVPGVLCAAIGIVYEKRRPLYRFVYFAIAALGAFTAFALACRSAFVSLALGIVLIVWQATNDIKGQQKRLFVKISIVLVALLVVQAAYVLAQGTNSERLFDLNDDSGRGRLWDKAWDMIDENPVFGGGFDYWDDNSGESLGTHNTFLTIMVMSGYVGGILFALFLIAVFLDLLGVRNLIPLAFLMELLMHSYTESGMDYYAYIPLILALVLARYISYQSDDITSLFR